MNVKKFGWLIAGLGVILGLVAAWFAYLPYDMRWVHAAAIQKSIAGYPQDEILLSAQFAIYQSRVFVFGVVSAVVIFIGLALVISSNNQK